jgi:pimeloyl-ACP methyl ester carboxylesterase
MMLRIARVAASIALVVFSCAASGRPKAPPGLTLVVRGKGPDVVLVHGALGDYRQWTPIGEALSRGYHVTMVSRRFHWPSRSVPGDSKYTFEAQSADLSALLATFDHPVHLVGHSYGAGVALLTALSHPERVRSLTLIEPPFATLVSGSVPGFDSERASRDSMVGAVRAAPQTGGPERIAEVLMDWMQGGPGGFQRLPGDVRAQLVANAGTAIPMFATPPPRVTCDQLRQLQIPVLVLRGEHTRAWFRFISEATVGCLPHAEAGIIPAAGHMSIVENPTGVARLVGAFIARRP